MYKTCASKIGLWICGSFFILIAVVFFFWAASEYIKGIYIFGGVAACVINTVLFFALGAIAQKTHETNNKVKEIYSKIEQICNREEN